MNIGIDLDNIVVNTTESLIIYLNERIPNLNLKMEDLKEYYVENNISKEYALVVKEAFENKNLWKKVKIISEARTYIEKLYNDGHNLYFVTSSLPENLYKKINHLSRGLTFLPKNYIQQHTINIHKKQLLNLDILIDDCLSNLLGERAYESICLNYPWNNKELSEHIWRADSWKEIYDIINKLNDYKNSEKT